MTEDKANGNEVKYCMEVTEKEFLGIFSMCNLMVMNAVDFESLSQEEQKDFELSFYKFRDIISSMSSEDIRDIIVHLDDIRKDIIKQKEKNEEGKNGE
ncbi:MAG TPA: hypothetical protein PK024_12115 [Methanospirillum sp.]|uniref:hypothetical protein n=1 Tax=Methanospirillum sp. TaxID=45200 RepID=UPI002C52B29B|nr:hypothetical protein [Methanospirillum sp.]HOJ97568.1 hypothetical protein [Methanospirillum sp.]